MAITAKQNEDIQKQYDLLRSQGQTKEAATASIKSTLQGATTSSGANVYDTLKSNFKTPEVAINTDVMREYNPSYNPDVPTQISGTLGTKPTDSIAKNNQALSGISETPAKTPLQLAQEATAQKQAELDKKNQEFTALENKGAESELGAGVIPGMGKGNAQTNILSSTSEFLQKNLKNELANLDAQKKEAEKLLKDGALTADEQKTTLQPYDQFLEKVTKLKEINEGQIKREQEDLKTRYNTTIDRQRKANELALLNAQKIAAITGVGFTSGGIQGINNIIDEGNQAITSLESERESMLSKYKDADAKLDIEYLDTITTIQNESKKALQDRYNSVITQIQKIDAEKGKASKEGLLAIKEVTKEYFDALDKQWDKDFKMMDFNYKKLLDYKKDVREQESITRDQQKDQLALLQKGDLTSLTDEDIMNISQDMDLDSGAFNGLILIREQQKKDSELERRKFEEITPYQRAQLDIEERKLAKEEKKKEEEGFPVGPTGATGGTDLRSTASKYPNEASVKNNNPAGITFNNTFAQTLTNAGINFEKGTARPTAEGGNYFSFPNVEAGFKAYELLWDSPSYSNLTVGNALKRWGTGALPGVDTSKKVSQLTEGEKTQLQMAHIKKESPGMYKELVANGIFGPGGINLQKVQPQGKKEYTATDEALFDKFLSGKDSAGDIKTLRQLGFTKQDIDSYAKTKPSMAGLSDDQRVEISKEKSAFRSNPVIKSFEESLSANRDLVTSLNSGLKGPGDVAAVFQFMKSLDPQSVVREGEFQLAATTAGYAGTASKLLENLSNPNDKSWLVPENREAFRKLAQAYVENKAKSYDRLYDDMVKSTKYWGAPDELIPKRASDEVKVKSPSTAKSSNPRINEIRALLKK